MSAVQVDPTRIEHLFQPCVYVIWTGDRWQVRCDWTESYLYATNLDDEDGEPIEEREAPGSKEACETMDAWAKKSPQQWVIHGPAPASTPRVTITAVECLQCHYLATDPAECEDWNEGIGAAGVCPDCKAKGAPTRWWLSDGTVNQTEDGVEGQLLHWTIRPPKGNPAHHTDDQESKHP